MSEPARAAEAAVESDAAIRPDDAAKSAGGGPAATIAGARHIPGLSGHASTDRRTIRSLQRSAGNGTVTALLANHRHTGRGAAPAVQRQGPPSAPTTSVDPVANPAEAALLVEEEDAHKVITTTKGSGTIWLVNPRAVHADLKDKEVEEFTVAEIVPRTSGAEARKSFDTESAATAFVVGTVGAGAVLQQGKFYFGARLGAAPSLDRSKVRRIDVRGPVRKIVGSDGFVFEPGTGYMTDADMAAKTPNPQKELAGAATAADLARLAGIQRPEDLVAGGPTGAGQSKVGDGAAVEIPESQVRVFLRQYLVARGLELLDKNEAHALEQQQLFRATDPGSETRKPSGLSPEAQNQVDAAREVGKSFKKLIDQELWLEDLLARVDRRRSFGSGTSTTLVELEGKRLKVSTWYKRIETSRKVIAGGKARAMSENPLLAQMVETRIPQEDWAKQAKDVMSVVGGAGGALSVKFWDRLTNQDNPYSRSELANPASKESDEKVRAGYVEKLDGVLKAIREVRAMVLTGDERKLWGMAGLRQRVQADLKSISGPNSKLGPAMEKVMADLGSSAGDIAATVITVAGVVLQLAGFFFPPAAFIGAVMTFGASAYNMDKALDQLKASQTGVTPAEALVDSAMAQKATIDATIEVALEALNVGMELNVALQAMETGRAKDLEKLAEKGRKPGTPDEVPPKVDPTDPARAAGAPGGPGPAAPKSTGAATGPGGVLDPRVTTPSGLASAESLVKYGEKVNDLRKTWAAKSDVERAFEIQAMLNAQLKQAGVPKNVLVTPNKSIKGMNAHFNAPTWAVNVSHDILQAGNMTPELMAVIGGLMYHEARHAEQYTLMARLLASGEKDAAVIAKKLYIPQEVAEHAVANPLKVGTPEYVAAAKWHESIFGARSARRTALLKEGGLLELSKQARDASQANYNRLVADGAPRAMRDEALAKWQRDYETWRAYEIEYRSLAEEQDAYLMSVRVEATVMAPPPTPDLPPTTVRMPGAPANPGP